VLHEIVTENQIHFKALQKYGFLTAMLGYKLYFATTGLRKNDQSTKEDRKT
tara:strand:- start:75 stop:227 length:153 start_codon:yes stop_codon:yes gene_type:complete